MATAGPNSPSAASGWSNSSNVYSSNNAYATWTAGTGENTAVLKAQGYGFAIPAGSIINGVTVVAEVKASASSSLYTDQMYLLDASGNATGTNKADAGSYWTASDANHTYGSSSDIWGCALTDTWINDADFGVALRAHNADVATRTASVDYISITIDYVAGGQPMQARSRAVPYVRKSRIGW